MVSFWTLVGPDFAGKSTVLAHLHAEHGWHVISYGDPYLNHDPLIRKIRDEWPHEAYARAGQAYSAELVLALLHPIVLYLRDELRRASDREHVIVDSYYYKLLAKCRLLGLEHVPTFNYWRSFPQPRRVLYLDIKPRVAWVRSGNGSALNAFEYHDIVPTLAGFARLQAELRTVVLQEVAELPVTIIDGGAPLDSVVADVLATLLEEEAA